MEAVKYYMFDFWEKESDPSINEYFLMRGGPWVAISVVSAYVYFVTKLGPALMKNREPFQLKKPILIYNSFMTLVNLYFFYEIVVNFRLGIDMNMYNFNRPARIAPQNRTPKELRVVHLGYLFLLSKYMDLVETVFFVLRKKYNQVSALHVYHHSAVPLLVYIFIKVSPTGGPGCVFPFLNTFIHVSKYSCPFRVETISLALLFKE